MNAQPLPIARQHLAWRAAFVLALAVLAAWLAWRNAGLHPVIFVDEWYYSKMARLTPLAEAIVPSYLYLWLFGATNACGDGFLDCARGINLALYTGAVPFLYLTARRFTGHGWAAAIALASMLAPLNVYTTFFMPEATYYFGFCILSWAMLAHPGRPLPLLALAGGAVLGAMSLVKVHALFLLPALCLYLMYASWHAGGPWLARGLGAAAIAGVLAPGVKFALGFVLAGDAGLSLLGPFYANAAGGGALADRLALLAPAWTSARGHLMALAVLLGLPLAILLHGLGSSALHVRGARANPLLVYTLLMLGAALGLTAIHAGSVAYLGSNEGLRLHLRYYSIVFPLLWIVAAIAPEGDEPDRLSWLRWPIAALMAALLYAAWKDLSSYVIYLIDGPDIASIKRTLLSGRAIYVLQLALLTLWALRRWNAARLFLLTVLPLSLLVAQQGIVTFQADYRAAAPGDRAGMLARALVPAAERGQLTVVCADSQQLMRAQFHIDHSGSRQMQMDAHVPIEPYQMPIDQKWLLVIGHHPLPPSAHVVHRGSDFALVRLPDPKPGLARIVLSAPPDPAVVSAVAGLSEIESWGRWSDGKTVTVTFAQALPRRVSIMLRARAYMVNATLPFRMEVGGASQEFRVGSGLQTVVLDFDTDGATRSLTIVVPHPMFTDPQGKSGRQLGIGLEELVLTGTH